jgi:hypothetical protein
MSPVLRTFLMWLLMLAIPVQGFAASAMLHCGPSHQRQQQAAHAIGGLATGGPVTTEPAAGGHAAHAVHHASHPGQDAHAAHHGMSAGADAPISLDSADGADGGTSTPLSAAKCSACAYCCHAVAIIGTPPAIVVATPDSVPEAAAPPRVEATAPDGLDRPPRPPLV